MKLRIWDFCSGAGGFSCGAQLASRGHRYTAVDSWDLALQTYARNIENAEIIECDIMSIDAETIGKPDVIIGSPPCPTFSGMNIKGNRCYDTTIIDKFLSIVRITRPRFWVMEESPYAAHSVDHPRFLRARDFGLYHERRRLFAGNYPRVRPLRTVNAIHPTPVANEVKAFNKNMRHRPDARSCCQWFGRRLTSWELQVLMGFPPGYEFLGTYNERCIQIGNAVCPPVSKAIFSEIIKHWNDVNLLELAAMG